MFVARVKACQVPAAALEAARMACHFDGLLSWAHCKKLATIYMGLCIMLLGQKENNDNNNNDLLWQRGDLATESCPCKPQIHEFMILKIPVEHDNMQQMIS